MTGDRLEAFLQGQGGDLVVTCGRVLLVIVGAVVIRALLHRLIDRAVRGAVEGVPGVLRPLPRGGLAAVLETTPALSERPAQRAGTIGSLLRSIASFTVFVVAFTTILGELGFDLAPVLASAGIVGVAVGFGAQNLVKDFLSGIFMILEDQYGVGDVIDAGEANGVVEGVGLRTTRLRDVEGTVWHIRNGEILRVGNKSQGWARALLDIPVAFDSDVPRVRDLVKQVADSVWHDPEFEGQVLEEPEVWGVEAIRNDGLVIRLVVKTAPLKQWDVARELRQRVKAAFDEAGIEVGVPRSAVSTIGGAAPVPAPSAGAPVGG
ncbi:MAG: mechanosensitive ion channel family protein [Actinomycetota bacterium]|nr:mechanosensitive ion channel family protein [Actinomycetota bacterium]